MSAVNTEEYYLGTYPDTTPMDDTFTGITNYIYSFICPHCNAWMWNYQWFHYCPYCGKQIFPQIDSKIEVLKKLDKILEEIENIKTELTK